MAKFESSKTHNFLQEMLAGDAQGYVRLMYFASMADQEGNAEAAARLREAAEGELQHAFGHLEMLEQAGDPVTEMPLGGVSENLASALEGLRFDCDSLYRRFMSTARDEELFDQADWIETVIEDKRHFIASLEAVQP